MGEVVIVSVPSVVAVSDGSPGAVEVESTANTVVEVGYAQPAGDGSGSAAGYFSQQFMVANTTFTVNHNLGQFPAVTFVNTFGVVLYGDVIYLNDNSFTITFTAAESGTVYCN